MVVLYIILGILVVIALYVIGVYNKLVILRERVKKAWRDIDIQLKRRFDLIPNLVNSVKGYMTHEKETLEQVTKLRTGYNNATTLGEKAKITSEMDKLSSQIMVNVEAYPDIKANENIIALQAELKNTEDKIGYSRQFYNDIVTKYNQSLKVFPENIVANIFRFEAQELFKIDNVEERENVKVEF